MLKEIIENHLEEMKDEELQKEWEEVRARQVELMEQVRKNETVEHLCAKELNKRGKNPFHAEDIIENQEKYNLNNEFVEMVLAHKTAGAVEQTYNRAKNIEDMRMIVNW